MAWIVALAQLRNQSEQLGKPLSFWQWDPHYRLLTIVIPMLLAHITAPLIGLVDTAVLGHMPGSHFLAGASFAALLLSQLYWVCGFLRMSTTGLSAQAKGQGSQLAATRVFYQSVFSAGILSALVLLFSDQLLQVSLNFAGPNPQVLSVITDYFNVRVWGAPAALVNLAAVGWLLGQQKAKAVMLIQISANLINVALNMLFVFGFGWDVKGVAAASIIAEYFILISSLLVIHRHGLTALEFSWLGTSGLKVISKLNSAILVRNLALQACLVFMTFQGLRLGQDTAAINAILMQFFVLISLGLDAVAFGAEAKVGEAKGARKQQTLIFYVNLSLFWSMLFAFSYSLVFFIFGEMIVNLLTDQKSLQQATYEFLIIAWLLPLLAHWCFLFDGIFIGLTRAKAMQNSMIVSSALVFFPTWWFLSELQNWGLWIALLSFMVARGVNLGGYYFYLFRLRRLID